MPTHKLILGEKQWDVPSPLQFGVLRIVEPGISAQIAKWKERKARHEAGDAPIISTPQDHDDMAAIIVPTLNSFDPTVTAESFAKLPMTVEQLTAAMQVIAKAAGMWKEPAPGEAKPVTTPPAWLPPSP